MDKLKLNLDDLNVESFDTTPENDKSRKGTVLGYYVEPYTESCDNYDCGGGGGGGGGSYDCGSDYLHCTELTECNYCTEGQGTECA